MFIAAWGERPVSEITKTDVLEIIITKRNTAPQMARALLVLIKRFFGWCVDQEIYGLPTSPCEGLSGKKLIGELQSRTRRLSDIELAAFWRATGRMGYPAGSVYLFGGHLERLAPVWATSGLHIRGAPMQIGANVCAPI